MKQYKIKISNPGNHFANPLLGLAGREFKTREAAADAIYDALFDVIDGGRFEPIDHADYVSPELAADDDTRDDEYNEAHGRYMEASFNYILREGCATEDGVTASIEEVAA